MFISESLFLEFIEDLFEGKKALELDSEHFNKWRESSWSEGSRDGHASSVQFLKDRQIKRDETAKLLRKYRNTPKYSRMELNREIDSLIDDHYEDRDDETKPKNNVHRPRHFPSVLNALWKTYP